jgi:hypothetical protein
MAAAAATEAAKQVPITSNNTNQKMTMAATAATSRRVKACRCSPCQTAAYAVQVQMTNDTPHLNITMAATAATSRPVNSLSL